MLNGLAAGLCIGFTFGIALEKSKVYLPFVIREQMLLHNFIMLKVFLSATVMGTIVTALLELSGVSARVAKATALGFGLFRGYGANILGT